MRKGPSDEEILAVADSIGADLFTEAIPEPEWTKRETERQKAAAEHWMDQEIERRKEEVKQKKTEKDRQKLIEIVQSSDTPQAEWERAAKQLWGDKFTKTHQNQQQTTEAALESIKSAEEKIAQLRTQIDYVINQKAHGRQGVRRTVLQDIANIKAMMDRWPEQFVAPRDFIKALETAPATPEKAPAP
jgi:hypothetical protein